MFGMESLGKFPRPNIGSGDAEVKLLPDNLWQFSGNLRQILANPGYFLANPG